MSANLASLETGKNANIPVWKMAQVGLPDKQIIHNKQTINIHEEILS